MDLNAIDARIGERDLRERRRAARRQSASRVSDRDPIAHFDRAGTYARIQSTSTHDFRTLRPIRTEHSVHPRDAGREIIGVLRQPFFERCAWHATIDHPRRPCAQMGVARRECSAETVGVGYSPRAQHSVAKVDRRWRRKLGIHQRCEVEAQDRDLAGTPKAIRRRSLLSQILADRAQILADLKQRISC
jgi:hypothetical protein